MYHISSSGRIALLLCSPALVHCPLSRTEAGLYISEASIGLQGHRYWNIRPVSLRSPGSSRSRKVKPWLFSILREKVWNWIDIICVFSRIIKRIQHFSSSNWRVRGLFGGRFPIDWMPERDLTGYRRESSDSWLRHHRPVPRHGTPNWPMTNSI